MIFKRKAEGFGISYINNMIYPSFGSNHYHWRIVKKSVCVFSFKKAEQSITYRLMEYNKEPCPPFYLKQVKMGACMIFYI